MQNKKNYVCLRGANCPVSVATRKKCPACRFDKCLRTGMKLEGEFIFLFKKYQFEFGKLQLYFLSQQSARTAPGAAALPTSAPTPSLPASCPTAEGGPPRTLLPRRPCRPRRLPRPQQPPPPSPPAPLRHRILLQPPPRPRQPPPRPLYSPFPPRSNTTLLPLPQSSPRSLRRCRRGCLRCPPPRPRLRPLPR